MKKRFSKRANRVLCILAAIMLIVTSVSVGAVADDQIVLDMPSVSVQGDTLAPTLTVGAPSTGSGTTEGVDYTWSADEGVKSTIKSSLTEKRGLNGGVIVQLLDLAAGTGAPDDSTIKASDITVNGLSTALSVRGEDKIYVFYTDNTVDSKGFYSFEFVKGPIDPADAITFTPTQGYGRYVFANTLGKEPILGEDEIKPTGKFDLTYRNPADFPLANNDTSIVKPATEPSAAPAIQKVAFGEKTTITKEQPTAEGYKFLGWYLYRMENANGTTIEERTYYRMGFDANNKVVPFAEATKLYLKPGETYSVFKDCDTLVSAWQKVDEPAANSYTITYTHPDDASAVGGLPTDEAKYTVDQSIKVLGLAEGTVREGYTFAGWKMTDGRDEVYNADDSIELKSLNVNSRNLIMVSTWKENSGKYTVTYKNPDGIEITGALPTDDKSYTTGESVTVAGGTTLIYKGYTFAGWTLEGGDGTVYQSKSTITVADKNIVLVSAWTSKGNPYSAQFFIRKDSTAVDEDGKTTQYSSSQYTSHGRIFGEVYGNKFVEGTLDLVNAILKGEGNGQGSVDENVARFDPILETISKMPSEEAIENTLRDEFGAQTLQDYRGKKVRILWYVVKKADGGDDCGAHVDGILYNVASGKPIYPEAKDAEYNLHHVYTTYYMNNGVQVDTKVNTVIGHIDGEGRVVEGAIKGINGANLNAASGLINKYRINNGVPFAFDENSAENKKIVTLDKDKTSDIYVWYTVKVDAEQVSYDWNLPTGITKVNEGFTVPVDKNYYAKNDSVFPYSPLYNGEEMTTTDKLDEIINGYKFVGWTRKDIDANTLYSGRKLISGNNEAFGFGMLNKQEINTKLAPEVLIANWVNVEVSNVTYENTKDGPEVDPALWPKDDKDYAKDEDITIADYKDINDKITGAEIIGWVVKGDEDGTVYQPGDTIKATEDDVTFVPVWSLSGQVKYDANFPNGYKNNGTAPVDPKTYKTVGTDSTVTVLDDNNMSVVDHTFAGWQLYTAGGKVVLNPKEGSNGLWSVNDTLTFIPNTTFKAVWNLAGEVYVTFYAGNYNGTATQVSRLAIDPKANDGAGGNITKPSDASVSRMNYRIDNVGYIFNSTWSSTQNGVAITVPERTNTTLTFYARYNTENVPVGPGPNPDGSVTTTTPQGGGPIIPGNTTTTASGNGGGNGDNNNNPAVSGSTSGGQAGVNGNENNRNGGGANGTNTGRTTTIGNQQVALVEPTIQAIADVLFGVAPEGTAIGVANQQNAAINPPVVNEEEIDPNYTPTGAITPEEEIPDLLIATSANVPAWALLNLLLMISTLVGCAFRLIGYFTNKKNPEADEAYAEASANTAVQFSYGEAQNVAGDRPVEDAKITRRRALARLFSIVPAVIGIVTFFLTEDLTQPMVLIDQYTLFMMALAIVQLVVSLVFSKKKLKKDDNNKGGMDKGAFANA